MKSEPNGKKIPENMQDCTTITCNECAFGYILPKIEYSKRKWQKCVVIKAYFKQNNLCITPASFDECTSIRCIECPYYNRLPEVEKVEYYYKICDLRSELEDNEFSDGTSMRSGINGKMIPVNISECNFVLCQDCAYSSLLTKSKLSKASPSTCPVRKLFREIKLEDNHRCK